jgi:basic membrane protein A and related proteins
MKFSIVFAIAIAVCASAASMPAAMSFDGVPKPVFVFAGPKDDAGWNQAFDRARSKLESAMHMTIPYVETGEQADVRTATESFIKQGRNIVVGDSDKFAVAFKALATQYGRTALINITDSIVDAPRAPNLRSVYGRSYESQYLCGVVAGENSKKADIGFLALRPSPIANWEINGYTLGVLKANPKATVHVVFIGEASSAKERAATSTLIDQGADVVGQSTDGPTPQIVAQERGIFATGHAVDLHTIAPKSTLCSSIWVWDRYLTREIRTISSGNWQADPSSVLLGITRGGTDIACCGTVVTAQMMAKLNTERDGIMINQNQVFAGPIVDTDNRAPVPMGAVLSDAKLWKMDWYVKGVVIDR